MIDGDSICPLCEQEPETLEHVLLRCTHSVYQRSNVTAATIEDLVCLAVHECEDIDALVASVASTGLYDRTECSSKGFTKLPGFAYFDPSANGSADLARLVDAHRGV